MGKLPGELWASEKNDLRAAISRGFWASWGERFLGSRGELLVTQGDHGIDAGRAPRGNVACYERDGGE